MGDVVNLRLARKAAVRRTREAQAAANRLAHGRTRAEREATKAEKERAARLLDGAKRDGHD
jgi:hypothetical protein